MFSIAPTQPTRVARRFTTPAVHEILDPRSGRPAQVAGFSPRSQRERVVASLIRAGH